MKRQSRERKEALTAQEFLAQLSQDPEYQEKQRELQQKRHEATVAYTTELAPILTELAKCGFAVPSLEALPRLGRSYEAAVPVLVSSLFKTGNVGVKEAIIRALSVPWATSAAGSLIEEFKRCDDASGTGLKWVIGNALSIVASDDYWVPLVELVKDKGHGKSREMLTLALGNLRHPDVVDALIRLLSDNEVAGQAITALGKLGDSRAVAAIEPLLRHTKPWIRKEAKRVLTGLTRGSRSTVKASRAL